MTKIIKKELEEVNLKAAKIMRKKNELEEKLLIEESLPALRKGLGKCFKYSNSYGGDLPRWPLYIKIIALDESNMTFTCVEFQKTSMDRIDMCYKNVYNFRGTFYFGKDSSYVEISKGEYNRAKKNLLKFVEKVLSE